MKRTIKLITKVTLLVAICYLISACGEKQAKRPLSTETIDSGTVEVFCDEAYSFALDSIFAMYRQQYQKVNLKVNYVNARNATSQLLGGKTRVAIIGRDYLADEDSIMANYNIKPYYQMDLANDGLVFFTQVDFPIDTLNDEILLQVLTQKKKFKDFFPTLKEEPSLAISHQNSSEYGNLLNLVCKRNALNYPVQLLPNSDSVLAFVEQNPNSIGVCYLSQVQGKFFKLLRIGYTDEKGNYVQATKIPHQSFIIMGEYPYKTLLRLYLLEDRKNLPFWFGAFIEKENVSVNYYKKMKLIPSYAKYSLEDER
jgi:ABC-type phosphate transport system substrate-binding protein